MSSSDAGGGRGASGSALVLPGVKHRIVVLSGKGGVGKSTVAVNVAAALAAAGKRVGILDVDIHGPSVPTLLGLADRSVSAAGADGSLSPVIVDTGAAQGVRVMSIGFLLRDRDDAVIWRGPMKMNMIKHFLEQVAWGTLDYLVIDCPPGTGDEPLSVLQLVERITGAIIVTTPQELAVIDVRKCITFCRSLKVPVAGVIENMSGFVCPSCGEVTAVFSRGGGERMAREMGVPFLGSIPLDPAIVTAGDAGEPFMFARAGTKTAAAFQSVVGPLLERHEEEAPKASPTEERNGMRIAIPVAGGSLALHFGHCAEFALVDVDPQTKEIVGSARLTPPDHAPGVLPRWLHEQGATVIIAGGMGSRAQGLFSENGITVVVGAGADTPENLVRSYLNGTLAAGENICDH